MSDRATIGELVGAEVLEVGDGYRTRRDQLATDGFRIVRAADVHTGEVHFSGPDFVSCDYAPAIAAKQCHLGDVVLTTKGSVGRVAIVKELTELAVYSPQLCYFRVRQTRRLHPRYLSYWLRSPEFTNQSAHLMARTDMAPYISLADMRTVTMTQRPLGAQRAIAEVLGALDDKIAANTRLASVLDELGDALVLRCLATGTVPLASVAEVTMGSSPRGEALNEAGAGMPFYQGTRDFGFRHPGRRVFTSEPIRTAAAGDILLSVRAPVGDVNVASESCCIGRGVAAIRSTEGQQASLFRQLRLIPVTWAPFNASGTVFGAITRGELERVQIPILDPSSKSNREECLSHLDRRLTAALLESARLAELRDALLPKLMSGELRVKDAERQVEEVL